MKALAEKAGISQPYLSDIENGKADGSISAIKALAAALDVDIDDLV
nr:MULTISPECIES: helix-turn-helix transcriptional regulator [unclassified Martelella]